MNNTTTDRPVFIKHCTMCGKELNEYELDPTLTFDLFPGYGSRYDMDHIHMELCWDCFDKITDWIRPQCEKDPVVEEDVDGDMEEYADYDTHDEALKRFVRWQQEEVAERAEGGHDSEEGQE